MGLGLQWAGANDAMAGQIRQQIVDRLQAQAQAKADAQQQLNNEFRQKQFDSNEELKNAQLKALTENRAAEQSDRVGNMNRAEAEQIAPGTLLQGNAPLVSGYLRPAGLGTDQQTLPSTQTQGDITGGDATSIQQQPKPTGMFIKGATNAQSEKALADQRAEAEAERKAAADAAKGDNEAPVMTVGPNGQPVYTSRSDAIGQRAFVKPTNESTVVVQTVDDQGNPVTKIVPKTAGSSFASKPSNQSERQTKAAQLALGDVEAVQSQLDAADKAGLIGPASGRLAGQFLAGVIGSTGNPDADKKLGGLRAAIQDLKTSYPMAISGTARGGAGGTDRLQSVLNSDKLSADLMHGALDEIHGALTRRSGKPSGASGSTSSVEDLIKKYGQPQQD